MYCKKCGKKLDYDGDLCEECRNRELVYGDEEKKAEEERKKQEEEKKAEEERRLAEEKAAAEAAEAQRLAEEAARKHSPIHRFLNSLKRFGNTIIEGDNEEGR